MNNKKQTFMIIGIFALILTLTSVTYAFFNYTRTGGDNTIGTGTISFNATQEGNINLSNVFPITSTEAETDTTNAKSTSITITGYTDYSRGVEYVITASDVNLSVGNKRLPIALEITVEGNNSKTLGTEETGDYYINRNNYSESKYKKEYNGEMEDESHLLVGYIAPNTTLGTAEGVDGIINIKAYIDADKVLISDTYDGTESDNMGTPNSLAEGKIIFTTSEWNSIQSSPLSFKIKVEANDGIWVKDPLTFGQLIGKKASTASYIASYDDIITSNPTFTTQDQVSNGGIKKTVYYYTGAEAAENANVLFAGYCWQIIRTTDNGGVRMIYNGVALNNKCETTRTATKGINGRSSSNLITHNMTSTALYGRSYDYDLETGMFTIKDSTGLPTLWSTSDNNGNGIIDYKELIGTYVCSSNTSSCSTLYYIGSINPTNPDQAYVGEYTIGNVAHYSQMGASAFNPFYGSMAFGGYMYNMAYTYTQPQKSGEYFATAIWENGEYTLLNGNGKTSCDLTHHYICDTDCTKIRYYYNNPGYYILLENGATVEDAIYQMTGNGDTLTKEKTINANYKLNNYNSAIKGYLDNWYEKNLTTYSNYLDNEAVYCNDRSISDYAAWNQSGTSLTTNLRFYRFNSNSDLNCINETDRFSVSNNKAELTYSIGLLTEAERYLMTSDFAKTGIEYWSNAPKYYKNAGINMNSVSTAGSRSNGDPQSAYAVRGVITLRPKTTLESGTGTYSDPYIIGPLVTRTN